MFERGKELERGLSPSPLRLPSPAISAYSLLPVILPGKGSEVRRQLLTITKQNQEVISLLKAGHGRRKMSGLILLVFAHPDDETSAAGGITAKYVSQGHTVDLVTATGGEKGTRLEVPEGVETATVRAKEQRTATAITGIRDIYRLGYIDGELEEANFNEVTCKVLEVMDKVQPEAMITFGPDGISGHPDHVAIGRAATAAFEKAIKRGGRLRKLYYVAIPESAFASVEQGEVGDVITRPDDEITTVIDISGFLETKLRALGKYRSQEDARWLVDMFRQAGESSWAGQEFLYLAYPRRSGKETDLFEGTGE
jgi:LmbE family N-acetylglucosaminyl deacetylase